MITDLGALLRNWLDQGRARFGSNQALTGDCAPIACRRSKSRRWLFVAGFSVAIVLGTQSPTLGEAPSHNGAWKAVATKSWWSDNRLPPSLDLIMTVTITGGVLTVKAVDATNAASPVTLAYHATLDAMIHPVAGPDRFNQLFAAQTGP